VKKVLLYILLFNLSFAAYSISVVREVNKTTIGNKQSAVVTVSIFKPGVDGIAKLIEEIPKGFRAFVTNKGGGKVLLGENGELKVVWLTLPVSDNVKVEYRLVHLGASVGVSEIKGSFTYIQNDIKQEESIDPVSITVGASEVKEEEVVVAKKVVPASVVYKVQLGVFSAKRDKSVFRGLPDIHYKKVNGFYKYFAGKFNTEGEAKKIIPKAKSKGFTGAFLVREKK